MPLHSQYWDFSVIDSNGKWGSFLHMWDKRPATQGIFNKPAAVGLGEDYGTGMDDSGLCSQRCRRHKTTDVRRLERRSN